MKKLLSAASALYAALLFNSGATAQSAGPEKQPFGKAPGGKEVFLYTLRNGSGMVVKITNFGGRVTSIEVPDRSKKTGDVVLGFDSLSGYTSKPAATSYFGALIGRFANRIAGGTFILNGQTYHVPTNENGKNSLHGGTHGFDSRVWDVKQASANSLELHYFSPNGEEGFPGNLNVTVRYSLDDRDGLRIDYTATTDKDTVINLTNHSYFNLSGPGSGPILNQNIVIDARRYTPVNANLIPTGTIDEVSGTPLDFRTARQIGVRINANFEQLKLANGYDHNFVLNHPGNLSAVAARVEDPKTGRVLEVFTTQPGIQFYTGNFLNGSVHGIGGTYTFRSALCLETQHFPDSPNHTNFPSTELHPGQVFNSTTIYRFSTK